MLEYRIKTSRLKIIYKCMEGRRRHGMIDSKMGKHE